MLEGRGWKRKSAVAEILRIGVGIAEIIADENRGLARQLEALAAFVAGDQVIQPHHIRTGLRELFPVFLAGSARQFFLLAANLPAHRSLEFAMAAGADQLYFTGFFFFRIKLALVHD